MTKKNQKNLGKTKKNQTWASDQTFSEKFCFFGFLVFSRFRRTSQLFDFSLGEKPWGKPKTSRKPKNQKTKTFQRMFGLRLMFVFFWFCLGFFLFFFGHDLEKIKKTQGFLVFWINWWLKTCEKTKKLRSFLVFCMDCFYMCSKNLSKKPKKTWVFLVFWLTSSKSSSKKTKNLEIF